jgi:uncharacterized protein
MPITAHYISLILVLLLVLSIRVILARRAAGVAIGDGGDSGLARRIRVQANLVEYAPLVLIGMAVSEFQQAHPIALHAIGLTLVLGRLVHAYGVSQTKEKLILRVTGMMLTFTAVAMTAVLTFLAAMS